MCSQSIFISSPSFVGRAVEYYGGTALRGWDGFVKPVGWWSLRLDGGGARVDLELVRDSLARGFRLEHDELAGALQDLPEEPIRAAERDLDDECFIGQLLDHGVILARPARPLR